MKFTLNEILECINYNTKLLNTEHLTIINSLYAITPQYLSKLTDIAKLPPYLQELQLTSQEYTRLFNYSLALNLKVVETYEEEE